MELDVSVNRLWVFQQLDVKELLIVVLQEITQIVSRLLFEGVPHNLEARGSKLQLHLEPSPFVHDFDVRNQIVTLHTVSNRFFFVLAVLIRKRYFLAQRQVPNVQVMTIRPTLQGLLSLDVLLERSQQNVELLFSILVLELCHRDILL